MCGELALEPFVLRGVRGAALAQPPLTTVQQPMRQLGQDATSMLIGLIGGLHEGDTHITLETTLVERGSTAPPEVLS